MASRVSPATLQGGATLADRGLEPPPTTSDDRPAVLDQLVDVPSCRGCPAGPRFNRRDLALPEQVPSLAGAATVSSRRRPPPRPVLAEVLVNNLVQYLVVRVGSRLDCFVSVDDVISGFAEILPPPAGGTSHRFEDVLFRRRERLDRPDQCLAVGGKRVTVGAFGALLGVHRFDAWLGTPAGRRSPRRWPVPSRWPASRCSAAVPGLLGGVRAPPSSRPVPPSSPRWG